MRRLLAAAVLAAPMIWAPASHAQAIGDEWDFEVSPYFWAAGIDGKIGVTRAFPPAEVSMDFNDIFDDLQLGIAGMFIARTGPLVFATNFSFVQTGSQATVLGPTLSSAHVETEIALLGGAAGWRVIDSGWTVDVLGGARHSWTDSDIDFHLTNGNTVSVSANADFIDGFVAVLAELPVATNWSLTGYADVGGGESDYTYQLYGGVNWDLAQKLAGNRRLSLLRCRL